MDTIWRVVQYSEKLHATELQLSTNLPPVHWKQTQFASIIMSFYGKYVDVWQQLFHGQFNSTMKFPFMAFITDIYIYDELHHLPIVVPLMVIIVWT